MTEMYAKYLLATKIFFCNFYKFAIVNFKLRFLSITQENIPNVQKKCILNVRKIMRKSQQLLTNN